MHKLLQIKDTEALFYSLYQEHGSRVSNSMSVQCMRQSHARMEKELKYVRAILDEYYMKSPALCGRVETDVEEYLELAGKGHSTYCVDKLLSKLVDRYEAEDKAASRNRVTPENVANLVQELADRRKQEDKEKEEKRLQERRSEVKRGYNDALHALTLVIDAANQVSNLPGLGTKVQANASYDDVGYNVWVRVKDIKTSNGFKGYVVFKYAGEGDKVIVARHNYGDATSYLATEVAPEDALTMFIDMAANASAGRAVE